MKKYEKLGYFLVRLVVVSLVVWSLVRFMMFVFMLFATKGFKYGGGWAPFFAAIVPFVLAVVLHLSAPLIVAYLARNLDD